MMEVRLYQATLCCRSLYDGMFELKTRTYMIMKSKDFYRNGQNTSDFRLLYCGELNNHHNLTKTCHNL